MSDFKTYFVCLCGRHYTASFDDPFFIDPKTCGGCGRSTRDNTVKQIKKWVSEAIWYNPSTWGKGYWDFPNE